MLGGVSSLSPALRSSATHLSGAVHLPATPVRFSLRPSPSRPGFHIAGRQERLRNAVNQSPGRDLRLDGLAVMQKSSGE